MKAFNKIFILIILLSSINLTAQGLKFATQEQISEFEDVPQDYGFAGDLPTSYSLEKYVPPVMTQKGGTCVGWSSLYYGLSTMYNAAFEVTNPRDKFVHAFDPYFIYSLMQSDVNHCDDGLYMKQAFVNLRSVGTKKMFLPPFTTCDESWNEEKFNSVTKLTLPYSIENYYYFDLSNPNLDLVGGVKKQIANKSPVIVGMAFKKSMYSYSSENTFGVDEGGLWTPRQSEEIDGGHAMAVIAYDDYKFGGAFKLVNSWGYDYGDNGYLWVKYSDFVEHTAEAYVMGLNENVKPNPQYKEGIDGNGYVRYGYNNEGKISTYEGQYMSDNINGLGIWHDTTTNTHFAGYFNNGQMEGYFLVYDEDGMFSTYVRNGKFEDWTKLGFAAGDDDGVIETQVSAEVYFDKLDLGFSGIRTSNSTSSLVQSKNE